MNDLHINVSTFSEPSYQLSNYTAYEPRIYRNFEELVCERESSTLTQFKFNEVYEKIKSKLFILNDTIPDLVVDEENTVYIEIINELKSKISTAYTSKIEKETLYSDVKTKYTNFCTNITLSIQSIESIDSKVDQTPFKNSLLEKIDEYYSDLNIESIKKDYDLAVIEFEKIKNVFLKLNSIMPSTMCQICLENQVDYYIDPCGHTICSKCKSSCEKSTNCHYCRNKRNKYCRLYL